MSITRYLSGQSLGWMPDYQVSTSTTQLNAAATWLAISFIANDAKTLSTIRAYVVALAGTLGANDITCDLYDSTGTNGAPGSAIETGKVPTATITGAGWYTFTGFSTALTANQQYWLVFKNVNGTPASNYCNMRSVTNLRMPYLLGSSAARFNWARAASVNSGSTWSIATGSPCIRIGYGDGSFDGMPLSNVAAAGSGDGIYGSNESGVKFTSPANAYLNARGVAFLFNGKTGSPAGLPRFGLWTGSSPVNQGYTTDLLSTSITGAQAVKAYFASTITINPNTVCRLTCGEDTNSDTSSNRYNLDEFIWDTDSNSELLLPWDGTCVKTYYNGSSWTDTAGSIFGHALILDTSGEFASGGGSGGGIIFGG